MSDNASIVQILIIILILIVVGGNLGLSVSGEIVQPELSEDEPGILNVLGWCWDGIGFFFAMIAFQVPGMPAWISAIFLVMTLLVLFIVLKWVRGTGGSG